MDGLIDTARYERSGERATYRSRANPNCHRSRMTNGRFSYTRICTTLADATIRPKHTPPTAKGLIHIPPVELHGAYILWRVQAGIAAASQHMEVAR
ncbi:MAG TPA: hypothetical protein VFN77_03315 [Acetobacteraceae bacterium]|nr:hypothetical protein [Acetobacteraceae bacterium]